MAALTSYTNRKPVVRTEFDPAISLGRKRVTGRCDTCEREGWVDAETKWAANEAGRLLQCQDC